MTALKRGLLNSSVFAGVTFAAVMTVAPLAWAQDLPEQTDRPQEEEETAVEEIVVTGSRIPRPNQTAPTAVTVVTTQQIESTGSINTGDIVRALPAAGVSAITPTNSGFATAGNGITTVDLRNLGEDRTLTLVNGRRFVPGVVGTQAVDYSTIPTNLIDRIDVITGGASAVYGSDALAGVVNILTRDDFEGMQLFGQYGISDRGDDVTYKLSGLVGSQFQDGRGHAVVNLGYDSVGAIRGRSRADEGMGVDATNVVLLGAPPNDYKGQVTTLSSFIPQARFLVPTTGNNLTGVFDDDQIFPYSAAAFGFNRTANRFLQVPSDRISAWTEFDYDITDDMRFFSEIAYIRTEAESEIEATPLGSDQVYGDLPFCDDFDGDGAITCENGIPLTSASVPELVKQQVRNANPGIADEDLVVGFARRTVEVGNRGNDLNRQTFRVVFGLEGDPRENMHYELSMNYGRTDDDQQSNGDVNTLRLQQALDTVVDPVTGAIVCSDPLAVAQGCVPVNIFGAGSITPAGAAFIRAPTSRDASIEEWVINGFVTGQAYQLPAGPLEWVVGSEYRQESSSDIPDGLTQAGLTSSNATPATVGQFDVYEFFGELRIPLLADMNWAQSLDLNLAGRWSEYSTVGWTQAYAASLEWQATDWMKLRGQYSRAVRAPNISELFQPASQDFPSVSDPCAGVTLSGGTPAFLNVRSSINDPSVALASGVNASTVGDPIAVSCMSDPNVAARVARDGGLSLTQFEFQGVSGFDGGNPDLEAETGKSWTFGVLFNPKFYDWLAPLSISIDYYDIKIENRISVLDEQVLATNCYAGGFDPGNPFCSAIVRFDDGPSIGALQFVNQTTDNFAETTAKGWDVQASYNLEFNDYFESTTDWGSLLASWNYTYVDELETVPFEGATPDDLVVERGLVGVPKNRWLLDLIYSRGLLQVAYSLNYIGESVLATDSDDVFFGAEIGERLFSDIQARYDVSDYATFYLGIDNIFDEYVRVGGTSGDAGQAVGWTTFPDVYDGIGRRYYGGVTLQF